MRIRLTEMVATDEPSAFLTAREFGRVLLGSPTIYLAVPLVCAHWAIVRGWAELWRRCGVTGTDNDIGRARHLPKPGLVHPKSLDVARSHRKGRPDPIVAQVKDRFRVKAHLLAQIGRHHRVVLPTPLILQKEVGIDLGSMTRIRRRWRRKR
jgi:hypothetical protein